MRDYVKHSKNVRANIRFREIEKSIERAQAETQKQIYTDLAIYRDKARKREKIAEQTKEKGEESVHPSVKRSSPYTAQDFFEKFIHTYQDKWLEDFRKSVGDFK